MSAQRPSQALWLVALASALLGGLAVYGLRLPSHAGSLTRQAEPAGMKWIPAGTFTMGTNDELSMPNERPAHGVHVDGFWMDEQPVTNAQFAAFVKATSYRTSHCPAGPPEPVGAGERHVIKGGSFLCHASYCESYRPTARRGTPADTGSQHVGFRCVVEARPRAREQRVAGPKADGSSQAE